MTRVVRAWAAMSRERQIAGLAAVALLVTMFMPWYGLQNLNRKTGAIYSHDINAFGDVSFVEAAIFLVAAGVIAMLVARAEERDFQLPGGDGLIVTIAGGWATVLIFYRVFSRPAGNGYPVGIEWGFFLAFVAAGCLAYAGWRIRHSEHGEPPLTRRRSREARAPAPEPPESSSGEHPPRRPERRSSRREPPTAPTALVPGTRDASPAPSERDRPRYPPSPHEQLSFEEDSAPDD
jgi:hypothetical protein